MYSNIRESVLKNNKDSLYLLCKSFIINLILRKNDNYSY